jgi:hypothetical protein
MRSRRLCIAAAVVLAFTATGRILEVYDMKTLIRQSTLVFVGRVKSVRPSGITTSLSYPTWKKVVFEWLKVDVEVIEPVKGTQRGGLIQTAMLSAHQPEDSIGMVDSPGMLEPKQGQCFLFCLAHTAISNVFAAFTAPYDDNQAILVLDRNHWEYKVIREGKTGLVPALDERAAVIWSLVDDAGQISPAGAARMRTNYAAEISAAPSNRVVYLQWRKYTTPAGWTSDVPRAQRTKPNWNNK